jgi:hypothetical protein
MCVFTPDDSFPSAYRRAAEIVASALGRKPGEPGTLRLASDLEQADDLPCPCGAEKPAARDLCRECQADTDACFAEHLAVEADQAARHAGRAGGAL